ncbi:MAG: hypothetical protein AAF206_22040, partial [Bacteroidota bacterium]
MRNLFTSYISFIIRFFRSFVCLLGCILCSLSDGSGQTIYDLAIELDSLYEGTSIEDPSSVEPFFAALRKVNKLPASYPIESLGANTGSILSSEIGLMSRLYQRTKDSEQNELSRLRAQKDSLAREGFRMMDVPEPKKNEFVRYAINTGAGTDLTVLFQLYKEFAFYEKKPVESLPDSIPRRLAEIELRIQLVDNHIQEIYNEKSNDINLILEEEALNLFPLGDDQPISSAPPIIIQNQGGGSAQSAIIDGTAKWLAERMRQELSIAFFDRFETWAEKENIHLLFPNTLSTLKSSANTDYTLMMEIYKRAFEKDLHQLTFHIPLFLENEIIDEKQTQQLKKEVAQLQFQIEKVKRSSLEGDQDNASITDPVVAQLFVEYKTRMNQTAAFPLWADGYQPTRPDSFWYQKDALSNILTDQRVAKQKELTRYQAIKYLSFSLNMINMLQEGQHPSVLLNSLYAQAPQLFPQNERLESVLLLLNVISQSLIATNSDQNTVWLGRQEIARLSADRQLRKFYFGLLQYRINYLINLKRKIQEQKRYQVLRQADKDSLRNMMKGEKELFNDIWDHVAEESHDPFWWQGRTDMRIDSFMRRKMANFDSPTFNQLPPEVQQTTFSRVVRSGILASRHPDYLIARKQLIDQDIIRQSSILSFISYGAENVDVDFPGVLLPSVYPRLDDIYSISSREYWNFYYHCINQDDFESAKASFLAEVGGSTGVERILRSELDPKRSIAKIDSINHIRLKDRYDFCVRWMKDDHYYNEYEEKKAKWQLYKQYNLDQDSLTLMRQLGEANQAFLQYDLQAIQIALQDTLLANFFNEKNNLGRLFGQFTQYTNKIDQINAQFNTLRASEQANFGNPEFIYLIKNSMGLLDLIFDFTIDKNDPSMVRNMEAIQFATNNLLDAYIAGLGKDYNAVVMNIIPVVEKLVANKYDKLILPLEAEATAKLSPDQLTMDLLPHSAALDSLRLLRDDKLRKMQEVFKYSTFIAAVAKSNNSDDVKKAINAIALPVGSYSIKRRTYANISLNAYPGITGGLELVQNNNFSEWAPNFGFTAPIGLSLNWGYRSKIKEGRYRRNIAYRKRVKKAEVGVDDRIFSGHSGSVFFSFIDLGALVLFRLSDANEP